MGFRLRGSKFFLTYAQANDASFSDVQSTIVDFAPVAYLRVARERHEDGGVHYHALVSFERILDRAISGHLDVAGYHPNIKPKGGAKAFANANEYCEKDGDFLDIGECPQVEEKEESSSILRRASEFPSFTEFLCACSDAGVQYGYCQAAWNATKTGGETYEDGTDYSEHVVSDFLRGRQWDLGSDRVLVIVGSSGTGKTSWAKTHAPKPALFVSTVDDLKQFVPGWHVSIIFDDMSFVGDGDGKGRWPITAQIHLCDWDHKRSIHCRYINVVIPAHVYKVFTCNSLPLEVDNEAVARRIKLIDLFTLY